MRQVVLNNKYYPIQGDIIRRNVNPWTARMSSGDPTYTDVSQGSIKEWHDFRGGIGLESELGGEQARLWFSEGVNTSIEKCLLLGPKVTTAGTFGKACVNMFDFLGKTYAYGDQLIAEWNTGTSAWVSRSVALATPISHCIVTDETATYAVVSSATAAYYTTDGTTWTELTGMKGYLSVLDHRLCGMSGNTLYFSPHGNIDGTVETKKFSAYLGTVHGMFQGKLLTTDEPVLYITSTEGLWALDFWTKQIYKQEVNFPPYDNAGKCGMYWNSYVWVATGPGIKRITPSLTNDVGPDQDDGLPYGYMGIVFDMTGGTDWVVYCVNGGSTDRSSIFKRHGTIGGNHQIYTTAAINTPIRCVHISPSSTYARGRLWWGEGTGIKYIDYPDFNANPQEINGYKYGDDSGKAILPIFRPLAAIPKVALRLQPLTENCRAIDVGESEGRYVTVYYDLCEGGGWVKADDFEISPLPTVYEFGTGGKGLQFYRIKFGIELHTDTETETPKMESLMFTWMPRPNRIRAWQFTVIAKADEAEQTFSDLYTAEDTKELIDFYPSGDKTKDSYEVVVTSLPSQIHWDANKQEGQILVTVEEVFRG